MTPTILRSVADLRAASRTFHREGGTIGIVPTMGALHEGHLSLVRNALQRCDRVIVTLFVNPKQFNSPDDLSAYPRTEASDVALLAPLGVDILYAPDAMEMYGMGFATTVSVGGVSEGLCGAHRPGHFDGVATVVTKLLLQGEADFAFFGEKDFQQLQVVRRLARDLDLAVEIVACPTVREADGLALSSRNIRLTPAQRSIAPALARALFSASGEISRGTAPAKTLKEAVIAVDAAGFDRIEYLELRDEETLAPIEKLTAPARLLAAAWLGETRLIDNVRVMPEPTKSD